MRTLCNDKGNEQIVDDLYGLKNERQETSLTGTGGLFQGYNELFGTFFYDVAVGINAQAKNCSSILKQFKASWKMTIM